MSGLYISSLYGSMAGVHIFSKNVGKFYAPENDMKQVPY